MICDVILEVVNAAKGSGCYHNVVDVCRNKDAVALVVVVGEEASIATALAKTHVH